MSLTRYFNLLTSYKDGLVLTACLQHRTGRVTAEQVSNMMNKLGRVPSNEESEFLFELIQMAGDQG